MDWKPDAATKWDSHVISSCSQIPIKTVPIVGTESGIRHQGISSAHTPDSRILYLWVLSG